MTTITFLLIVTTLFALFTSWWSSPRWLSGIPIVPVALVLAQLVVEGYDANLLPLYLIATCFLFIALRRSLGASVTSRPPRGGLPLLLALAGRGLALFGLFLVVRATLFYSLPPADLSQMSWEEAFAAAHKKLSREYAFGAWKKIDWETRYATYAPQVAAAATQQDRQAYYRALLAYTSSIPDGHVWLAGDDFGASALATGAGYGMELVTLDDGRVIAATVVPGGPAAAAGMAWGADIQAWNGLPVETALAQTAVIWPTRRGAPATGEGLRLEQERLLVRAPAGTEVKVVFRNPASSHLREVSLTAVADGQMSRASDEPLLPPVETGAILPEGYGYLKINNEHEDDDNPAQRVQAALRLFVDHNVPGVILDVRGNRGGADELVPQFVGFFFSAPDFYEKTTIYFQPLATFITRPPQLWIEPLQPHYSGPVVVLIDQATFSSGEGIAMAIKRLPQGEVIGFHGTYGSFGMTGGVIKLPEGLTLYFPDGQSLDREGVIQLDGNGALEGGVAPTIRAPLTLETAHALFVDREDVLLRVAIDDLGRTLAPTQAMARSTIVSIRN